MYIKRKLNRDSATIFFEEILEKIGDAGEIVAYNAVTGELVLDTHSILSVKDLVERTIEEGIENALWEFIVQTFLLQKKDIPAFKVAQKEAIMITIVYVPTSAKTFVKNLYDNKR